MLRAHKLAFSYPRRLGAAELAATAIAFPDIDLAQGGVMVLQGPSGCGKSTLLALCCGLQKASSGHLEVAGQNLGALTDLQRDAWRAKHIGFLPQRLHLSDSLNVRGNLELTFFAAGQAQSNSKLNAALDALGVLHLAQALPNELSGGQAQRVALARAVLLTPSVILADEPTANLDDTAAHLALDQLLRAAQTCQATLLIATHDARVVAALAARGAPWQLCQLSKSAYQATQRSTTGQADAH